MQCAYCLSDLPEGATVCAHCTRKQPISEGAAADRNFKLLIAGVVVLVVGWFGWQAVNHYQRQAAVERIVECAHLHGDKDFSADFANSEIDDGMQQTGKGWRAGAQYAALVMIKSGQLADGRCFVTQETLFSN